MSGFSAPWTARASKRCLGSEEQPSLAERRQVSRPALPRAGGSCHGPRMACGPGTDPGGAYTDPAGADLALGAPRRGARQKRRPPRIPSSRGSSCAKLGEPWRPRPCTSPTVVMRPSPKPSPKNQAGVVRQLPFVRDDAALVVGLRAGEAWARAALFDRYAPQVERILRRILGHDQHTDFADLIHDT